MSDSDTTISAASFTGPLHEVLDQARNAARDQITAAWQLHVARVEEQLHAGWEDHLIHLLEERFREMSDRFARELEESIERRMRAELERQRDKDRRELTHKLSEHLNQAARRLRRADRQEEWSSAVVDSATGLCRRASVFTVQGRQLRLERSGFLDGEFEVDLLDAPALAEAIESREPVIAAATAGEISASLLSAAGPECGPRVFLFPIIDRDRAVGLLCAEGNPDQVNAEALELLASIASSTWELRARTREAHSKAEHAAAAPSINGLVAIQAAVHDDDLESSPAEGGALVAVEAPPRPNWSELPSIEQDLHLKAQRFARVQVAEIRLFKSSAVKQGRHERSLFPLLRDDIERGREAFKKRFLDACPSMVDYFHLELVRTLANDNPELLGVEYPGPLA
jgi:hypothetical protein